MQPNNYIHLCLAALLGVVPFATQATTFFSDTFTGGSTLTNAAPANPTPYPSATATAYQLISSKSWVGQSLTPNDLKFGIGATTSGSTEVQTLFSTNPVALTANGDYVQLTVTFTNTSGLLTQSSALGFGLYNSGGLNGQVKPVTNGLNSTAVNTVSTAVTGAAQNWQGYVGQISFNAASHRIMTRAAQTGAGNNNQEAVTSGSGSSSYATPAAATVGATVPSTLTLTVGSTYTELLTITLLTNDFNSLAITNTLYAGPNTSGLVITNFGGIATNATLLTSAFDSLAIGWRATANSSATTIEISSIKVDGVATPVVGPPVITTQPVPVNVAANNSCIFKVVATGFNLTYQWHRNGTNLANNGNISGATSSTLVINSATAADVASGANGYYVTVTGAGNFSVDSTKAALALVAAKNLLWANAGTDWDLNTTANWLDPINPATFNYGDAVTFDDSGNASVNLAGTFLSPSTMTVDTATTIYNFTTTSGGSIAGIGKLIYKGAAQLTMNTANSYSGGTLISNATAKLFLQNLNGLGTGPITLAKAGGVLEIQPTGSSAVGIPGDIIVQDDFTIQADGAGTFAGQFFGSLSGAAGKTLTLTPKSPFATGPIRFRVGGTNTLMNANIILAGTPTSGTAQYDGTVLAFYAGSGTQTYNGVISGDGGLISRAGGTTLLNGVNTFTGGTTPTSGSIGLGNDSALGTGPLSLSPENGGNSGSGTIFASGGARTIANAIQYPIGTNNYSLTINGTNNLTFTGAMNLAGVDGGTISNHTFTVNNTGATTFSGIISDSALAIGLIKNGTNTLYLNGVNTYSGLTTVSAGRLAGSGTIASSVIVTTTNAAIGGGAAGSIGTLAVTGDLTLTNSAGGFFRVNRSGPASDRVSVTGGLTNFGTGAITVTNLGAALIAGDTFTLFNKAVVNGQNMTVTGAGVNWTNKLHLDGTIAVLSAIPTTPTNITFSVAGSTLSLSWPASYLGWSLQSNSVSLTATTNWFLVPGSAASTSINITVNPTKTNVFYRLVYP